MDTNLDQSIREYKPIDGSFIELERLFEQAFSSIDPRVYYDAIFNLFERYPDEDGAGVFWSAIHGVEHTGDYEEKLLVYFRRYPTLMTRTMLRRLQNSGGNSISGVNISNLIGR